MKPIGGIVTNTSNIPDNFRQVDIFNTDVLKTLWKVYSVNKDVIRKGRRLENLFWRLWTNERSGRALTGQLVGDLFMRIQRVDDIPPYRPCSEPERGQPAPPEFERPSLDLSNCPPTPPPSPIPSSLQRTCMSDTYLSKLPPHTAITESLQHALPAPQPPPTTSTPNTSSGSWSSVSPPTPRRPPGRRKRRTTGSRRKSNSSSNIGTATTPIVTTTTPTTSSTTASQDWIVDPDFRTKYIEQKQKSAVPPPAQYAKATSSRRRKNVLVVDELVPLKEEGSTVTSDVEAQGKFVKPKKLELPRRKSELTLLFEKEGAQDKRKKHKQKEKA